MKKIILKINSENIIEDIGESYQTIPTGYKEYEFDSYPNDLMTQTYKLIEGEIVRDEDLYTDFLLKQETDKPIEETDIKERANDIEENI